MNTQTSDLSIVDVAILAGGLGTRLRPKVKGKPKVLAEVRHRPFLEYLLEQLNVAHFKNIVLCTGYLHEQIREIFGEKYKDLHIKYSREQRPLGTGGSLRNALSSLNSKTIMVMNGDSFYDVDFEKLWQFHVRKKSNATMVLTTVPDISQSGSVTLGDDDRISEFQEKKEGNRRGLINAGIYVVAKTLIEEIPEKGNISLEKDIFPGWIGKRFFGYKTAGKFIDIGTPENYRKAERFFTKH